MKFFYLLLGALRQRLSNALAGDKSDSRKLSRTWATSRHFFSLSARRINFLLLVFRKAPKYLEIGVQRGFTLEAVVAKSRLGVDPAPRFDLSSCPPGTGFVSATSDDFFSENVEHGFAVIFLDGLHEAKQTYRDLLSALNCLESGGIILIDDVFPSDEASSLPDLELAEKRKAEEGISHLGWYGDVYKVLGMVSALHPELSVQLLGTRGSHVQACVWRNSPRLAPYLPEDFDTTPMSRWTFGENVKRSRIFGYQIERFAVVGLVRTVFAQRF